MLRPRLRRCAAAAALLVAGAGFGAAMAQGAAGQPVRPSTAPAGNAAPVAPSASPGSDAQRALPALGARIASQGVPGTAVAACASCHGQQGEGVAAAGFPRLAGQAPAYLARQIENFAQGRRNNPVMSPIAKAMNGDQNQAVAAYYGALNTTPPPAARAAPTAPGTAHSGAPNTRRGQTLANSGDDAALIQACANCHGAAGTGEGTAYPYLAGQHATYLTNALNEWKSGNRNTDPSGQMQLIAARLQDADITALAAYYSTQPPPIRRNVVTAQQAVRPSPPGRGGPPATAPAQGTGTEQGAPTTGGSQGIGGGGATTGVNPQR